MLHYHMLFLDGVYVRSADPAAPPVFCRVPAPTAAQLQRLLERISQRIGRYLERQGLLVRAPENDYLQLDAPDKEGARAFDRVSHRYGPSRRQEGIHLTNRACHRDE